ncbi:hypothetical protein [Rufibacter quisquiliarum]|uniref:Tissue inhibitor of metalloproteinase n=1 Tax=Rufibacter quisquiliarum TaxID=1549639 RepID=A0A839H0G2_9BACT|nr:hypothetical protein [Rufibacter quisquiliarum]MBA9079411.1 hypothetical protein [Rufibacter quisquiliarum]
MKKLILLTFLIVVIATDSITCKCGIYTTSLQAATQERYNSSDFVISAKVELVRDSLTKGNYFMEPGPYWRKGGYNVVINVKKAYKGEIKTDKIEITPSWSNCSQYFKIGDTYIIFGYINKKGEYTTDICSMNFSTDQKDRLRAFKKIKKKKT